MTKFAKLSTETNDIISNLYKQLRGKSIFSDTDKQLMVSLYRTMPFANQEVLSILRDYQINLSDYLTNEEIGCLQDEYSEVIPYCLLRTDINPDGIFHGREGFCHLPSSIVELCMEMAGSTSGKSVYLPYSADGTFALLCKEAEVKGFEWNQQYWAISQILASATHGSNNIALKNCNEEDPEIKNGIDRYDFVFSFPPMLNKKEERKIVDTFLRIITNQLKQGGELYAILPLTFCYEKSGWFDVRKILLEYGDQYSVLIVSLPSVVLPYTSAPICLVNFVKDGRGLIGLVDASGNEFVSSHNMAGYGVFDMNIQSILEIIKKQDEKHVWVGKATDLNSYLDLTPSRYILAQNLPSRVNGHETVQLKELIELIPLERKSAENNNPPLLGMKELSFKYLNCEISYNNIPVKEERISRVLSSDSLLAGFMGGKFKVGRINGLSSQKAVSLRNEVCAFRIISNRVTEEFLLRSLLSEFVEKQAAALASGAAITRLSKEDFLSIRIEVPSVEEQEKICKEDTRESISESERKVIESFEEFREDMHMKKHAIGQTIFNLNNWWKALQKARRDGHGEVKDSATVGKNQPVTVSEIYDSLQETISQLQQQINKFDRGNGLEIKNFALTEFIENYISRKKSPLFKFIYDSKPHHSNNELRDYSYDEETGVLSGGDNVIIEVGEPIEYVEFAPDALEIIFDNIVSNACCHGFEGREESTNIIRLELSSEGDDCVVSVSNNGEPLHDQISTKDVFTYSRTSKNGKGHFGIGGYEVKKLMREFGGDAEFISEPGSDYPITYRLVFHNTNIKSFEL